MTVSSFAEGDAFTVRLVKYHQNNPDRKWANNYEFVARSAGSEDELLALGMNMLTFERNMTFNAIVYDRLLISTWQPDSKPYNPAAFISSPLSEVGANATGGTDLEALNVCLAVRRVPAFGRFGHIFYRGNLVESEVSSPAGKAILTNRTQKQTDLETSLGLGGMDDYIGVAATGAFKMVMVSRDGSQIRTVIGLRAQGVSQVPADHAWFNRTSA